MRDITCNIWAFASPACAAVCSLMVNTTPACMLVLACSIPARATCRSCQTEDGADDVKKGTQLLEVYALEIQLHSAQKNSKRLKELYTRALTIKSAIPHPRIMGIIRECGGKMHMHERDWQEAATDFFEVQLTCSLCMACVSLARRLKELMSNRLMASRNLCMSYAGWTSHCLLWHILLC